MTTLAPPPAVNDYADAVRRHLAGLDPETLDELTGGLEADLAEALTEQVPDGGAPDLASVTAVFGSPADYAEELRVAAGVELPGQSAKQRRSLRDAVATFRMDLHADWARWRAEHAWFGAVIDFLVVLRPVWWVARGWVLFWMLVQPSYSQPLGSGLVQHLILLGAVIVSVMWGQRRFGQQRWLRRAGLLASVVAAFALVILVDLVGHQLGGASGYTTSSYDAGYMDGMNDGRQQAMAWYGDDATALTGPTNLFVYGPDGQPIEDAQIVDQAGNPIVLTAPETGTSWADWDGWWDGEPVPVPVLDDAPLNVYPWRYLEPEYLTQRDDGTVVGRTILADEPTWPAAMLFPVAGEEPTPDATEPTTDPTASD